jgi:hypothetical protein
MGTSTNNNHQPPESIRRHQSPQPRSADFPTAAELCPAPVESDFAYFEARPWARSRIRAPFPDEFPPEFLTHRDGGTAVVIVTVARRADGGTTKISRTVFCDHVMALRQPPKERKPKAAKPAPTAQETTTTRTDETAAGGPAFFSDEIPFNLESRG